MKLFYFSSVVILLLFNSVSAQGTIYTKVDGNGYGNVLIDTPQDANAIGNEAVKIITNGDGTVDGASRIILKAPKADATGSIYGDRFIVIDKPPTIDGNIDTTQIGDLAAGTGNGNLNDNRLINFDYYENDPQNENIQTKVHLTSAQG